MPPLFYDNQFSTRKPGDVILLKCIMYLLQVSVGTLLAFTIVAVCLLILRYVPPSEVSEVLQSLPGSSTAMEEYGSSGSTGPISHKEIIETSEEELQTPDSPSSATSGLSQNHMLLQEQANLAGIVHPLQVCVCPVYTAIVCRYLGST
jgi:cationic amino acid transporter 1